MLNIHYYENILKKFIYILEIFVYSFSILIITISIFYSIYIYFSEFNNITKAIEDTRLNLVESISLALSFILSIEILKVFYIKTYKQLIFIVTISLLKLTISYFLLKEMNNLKY